MKKIALCLAVVTVSLAGYSQENGGSFTGNIETIFQYLNKDSIIDADQPAQKGLLNSYMNVFYTNGNFRAGMRFEAYLPRIQGYPSNFDGVGIGMRYVGYTNDFVDVTLGSIYEQFGQGLSLRSYENRALGYDNFIDGARIIVTPHAGIKLKGVYGYQRFAFQNGRIEHGEGLVRGVDGEVNLNRAFKQLADKKLDVTLGGSLVSKFQRDNNSDLLLPENVGTYGGRANLRYGKYSLEGEYIIKEQDPSQDNAFIYNYGHAAVVNAAYSQKGLGIILQAKSVDNMSYRSDRSQQLQNLLINYLPAMTKTHTYNLVSSLYPYATQPVGEIAFQAEVLYTIKKGSKLGGKYGTSVNVNYSTAYRPKQDASGYNPLDSTGVTYVTKPFQMSDSLYWRDFNINIYRKFSKSFNLTLAYYNMLVNNDVATVSKEKGNIRSNVFIAEMGFKFKNHQSMRVELQGLVTGRRTDDSLRQEVSFFADNTKAEDKGDWATVLVEYNINSNWFVSVMDQYNVGNGFLSKTKKGKPVAVHHPYLTVGYVRGSTRLTASYGRQRAGLFCVGGVCRPVPASNGLTFSFTQSF